jgi:hypothetical protein
MSEHDFGLMFSFSVWKNFLLAFLGRLFRILNRVYYASSYPLLVQNFVTYAGRRIHQ